MAKRRAADGSDRNLLELVGKKRRKVVSTINRLLKEEGVRARLVEFQVAAPASRSKATPKPRPRGDVRRMATLSVAKVKGKCVKLPNGIIRCT